MKKIVKDTIGPLMWIVSKIYPYTFSFHLHVLRDVFYTMWIKNFIGYVGESSLIAYPCLLQGEGQKHVALGNNIRIQSHCVLGCWEKYGKKQFYSPEIIIGNDCNIGEYSHISAINQITIGDGLLTGRFVYIGDNAHGGLSWEEAKIPPVNRNLYSKGPITIGRNVWIGDRVSIFGGVTIGDNVIIGAGSIVTHDLPSNCIAVGAPAKIVKELSNV